VKPYAILRLAALAALPLLASGCATIVTGHTQEVTVESYPPDATVAVDGRVQGKTPLTLRLERDEPGMMLVSKSGYTPTTVHLSKRFNPWVWGNFILFPLFIPGMVTDGVSGAMHEYRPDAFSVRLHPRRRQTDLEPAALRFIEQNFQALINDLNRGDGPTLRRLFSLLAVDEDDRPDATDDLRQLAMTYDLPAVFARKAVEELSEEGHASAGR